MRIYVQVYSCATSLCIEHVHCVRIGGH